MGCERGIAFIMEADTEYQFYDALLLHCFQKHPEYKWEKCLDDATYEYYYKVQGPFEEITIRLNSVGTITQITNSIDWFNNVCAPKGCKIDWTVFLCYDTDAYEADITKFYKGDWEVFRKKLNLNRRVKRIVDMAAKADIEDIMLCDLHGISTYMGLDVDLEEDDVPSTGKKGAAKMKRLFLEQRKKGKTKAYYHKGERARSLIDCLDFEIIARSGILPLHEVEEACYSSQDAL